MEFSISWEYVNESGPNRSNVDRNDESTAKDEKLLLPLETPAVNGGEYLLSGENNLLFDSKLVYATPSADSSLSSSSCLSFNYYSSSSPPQPPLPFSTLSSTNLMGESNPMVMIYEHTTHATKCRSTTAFVDHHQQTPNEPFKNDNYPIEQSQQLLEPHENQQQLGSSWFINAPTMTYNSPANYTNCFLSPTASSSSLSLSVDSTNMFLFNDNINSKPNSNDQFSISTFAPTTSITKQDVSVGTDLSMTKDVKYKKDTWSNKNISLPLAHINSLSNSNAASTLNVKTHPCNVTNNDYVARVNEKESFKLVEKIQPKKSRTKYTKEQIEMLESAYWRNAYPDMVTVEHLCKSLVISKDKINIWFQNRRARSKRNGV